jgi:hypothetical protein
MKVYKCSKPYDSLEQLVKDKKIDAVAVFTEGPNHVRHVLECLKYGKHVLCAVPACWGTVEEAEILYEAVKKSGLIYMLAETSYYQQFTISARKFYQEGRFGEIFYCESEYQHDGLEKLYFENGTRTWRYGVAPMHYPTHCTAHLISVTGERLLKVTCNGWGDPWPAFRQIVRTESSDFVHWSEPEIVIRHKHDIQDPQSYGMTVSQIGNLHIGLMCSYKKPGNESIDVQLTISHDNKNWSQVANQETFIPLGVQGSWDDGMIFTAPLFNHGEKTLIYYGGWDNLHDSKERRRGNIGLATLRLNGFVSLDATDTGSITTRTMRNASGSLLVNVNASRGSLRAELLGVDGNPIPGYTANDCLPVQSDGLEELIQWRDHSKLPESQEALRIRFLITGTLLYGFYAGPDAVRMDK